MDSCNVRAFFL